MTTATTSAAVPDTGYRVLHMNAIRQLKCVKSGDAMDGLFVNLRFRVGTLLSTHLPSHTPIKHGMRGCQLVDTLIIRHMITPMTHLPLEAQGLYHTLPKNYRTY